MFQVHIQRIGDFCDSRLMATEGGYGSGFWGLKVKCGLVHIDADTHDDPLHTGAYGCFYQNACQFVILGIYIIWPFYAGIGQPGCQSVVNGQCHGFVEVKQGSCRQKRGFQEDGSGQILPGISYPLAFALTTARCLMVCAYHETFGCCRVLLNVIAQPGVCTRNRIEVNAF